jgi:hypothetical protein
MFNRFITSRNIVALIITWALLSSCVNPSLTDSIPTVVEIQPLPTPASTLPGLIENLSHEQPRVRIVSSYELLNYDPDEVVVAIPRLTENLHYDSVYVQESAAIVLGWLGRRAQDTVPDLIDIVESSNTFIGVRAAAAKALGKIEDTSAVPALAKQLNQSSNSHYTLEIESANSIAKLTNQDFREVDEVVHTLSVDDVPWIVIDARSWWENEGQYQRWDD